jgi:uncharacterized protein YecT (DUF1311 family)
MNRLKVINASWIAFILLISCQSNPKQNPCDKFDALDLKMLKLIELIEKKNSSNKRFLNSFKESQIYWIQYRNRQLKALYPLNNEHYEKEFGSDYNLCKCVEHTRLTKIRIKELERWVEQEDVNIPTCLN